MFRTLAVFSILVASPVGMAFEVELTESTNFLAPGLAGEEITLTITAECAEVAQYSGGDGASSTTVDFSVTPVTPNGSGVIISGPGLIIVENDCPSNPQGSLVSPPTAYQVAATREAAGLQTFPISWQVEGPVPLGEEEPSTGIAHENVTVDFHGAVMANFEKTIIRLAPGEEAAIGFTLTNEGNAPTVVSFELADPTSPELEVLLPENAVLGSANHGQDPVFQGTVMVSTASDSIFVNEVEPFQIVMTSWALDDPEKSGNPVTADILIRVRGENVDAPAATMPAILIGLVAAVLISRRRA